MTDFLQQILLFFGRGFCHQYAWRSLEASGLQFAVCARDTGLYLGFVVTLALAWGLARAKVRGGTAGRRRLLKGLPLPQLIVLGVLLGVPLVFDGISSYAGLRETSNLIRYATGYLCGTGLGLVVSQPAMSLLSALPQPHKTKNANTGSSLSREPRRVCLPREIAALALSIFVGAVFYGGYPFLGPLAPFLVLGCLWASVALINVLILSSVSATKLDEWLRLHRAAAGALIICATLIETALLSGAAWAFSWLLPWYVHP